MLGIISLLSNSARIELINNAGKIAITNIVIVAASIFFIYNVAGCGDFLPSSAVDLINCLAPLFIFDALHYAYIYYKRPPRAADELNNLLKKETNSRKGAIIPNIMFTIYTSQSAPLLEYCQRFTRLHDNHFLILQNNSSFTVVYKIHRSQIRQDEPNKDKYMIYVTSKKNITYNQLKDGLIRKGWEVLWEFK